MKRINIKDYNINNGTLIDVQIPSEYVEHGAPNSINIYADTLILNHKKYLEKRKKYYIICTKGYLSKKVVTMLEYFGYDVTQVIY
ncbi:MAG: rhodanese-like domain-containing protein [Clostridia bacterium]